MNVSKSMTIILTLALLGNLLDPGVIFSQEREQLTIAVVDFTNVGKDPSLEALVTGIPESITTYLAKKGKIRIVERNRMKAALEELKLGLTGIIDEQTAIQVGKAIGAAAVMVGSFIRIGDIIRINVRLIDVRTSEILAAEQVQGLLGTQLFDLMDQVAEAMWGRLMNRPIEIQPIPISKRPMVKKPAFYRRWWFWGILGAGIAGGAAYLATTTKAKEEEKGLLMITVTLSE